MFNARKKCEHIHVDLEYPQLPASYHLAPIAMHLCFCPFHPSYWRWKVQTVDPVSMGAKQIWCAFSCYRLSTINLRNNYWFSQATIRAHTRWSWISEMACKLSSGSHCDASLLLPFPPFILKMEGPDCRSCQHGCKAIWCAFSCYRLWTTN